CQKSSTAFAALLFCNGFRAQGLERRLLAACRWHAVTAVALPQQSKSAPAKKEAWSQTMLLFWHRVLRKDLKGSS
ncbi:MAG: hypothetical protein IJS31_05400, partial [Oscillospiraceae bacterium]|nr:hypothetical protein [Oscillospiraceae bacterium]